MMQKFRLSSGKKKSQRNMSSGAFGESTRSLSSKKSSRDKADVVEGWTKNTDPCDVIEMLERMGSTDNDRGFELLQGIKNLGISDENEAISREATANTHSPQAA